MEMEREQTYKTKSKRKKNYLFKSYREWLHLLLAHEIKRTRIF